MPKDSPVADDAPKVPTIDDLMTAAKTAAAKHKAAMDARVAAEHEYNDSIARQEEMRKASVVAFTALEDALAVMKVGG